MEWLAQQRVAHKYFVLLVPPQYAQQHRQHYYNRKKVFLAANPSYNIQFVEIHWLDLSAALEKSGLTSACAYARDFQSLLDEWFNVSPIKFTSAELGVTDMFNTDAPAALCEMIDFVEQMASELERDGALTVRRNFSKRWWESEYGIYLHCEDREVLFLGIWTAYWKSHGCPLCVALNHSISNRAIVGRFQQEFPAPVLYTAPGSKTQWLTKGIDRSRLTDNAVRDVSSWLLQGYLKDICKLANGAQPPTDNPPAAVEPTD